MRILYDEIRHGIPGDKLNLHGRVFLVPRKTFTRVVCTLYSSLHWTLTSHFLHGPRKTRPCITGHPVCKLTSATTSKSDGLTVSTVADVKNAPALDILVLIQVLFLFKNFLLIFSHVQGDQLNNTWPYLSGTL